MALIVQCPVGHGYIQADTYTGWPEGAPHCPVCFNEWAKTNKIVAMYTKTKQKPKRSKWHRAEDELPERHRRVLVVTVVPYLHMFIGTWDGEMWNHENGQGFDKPVGWWRNLPFFKEPKT